MVGQVAVRLVALNLSHHALLEHRALELVPLLFYAAATYHVLPVPTAGNRSEVILGFRV